MDTWIWNNVTLWKKQAAIWVYNLGLGLGFGQCLRQTDPGKNILLKNNCNIIAPIFYC